MKILAKVVYRLMGRCGVASVNEWNVVATQDVVEGQQLGQPSPDGFQVIVLAPNEPYTSDARTTSISSEIATRNGYSWRVVVSVDGQLIACLCATEHGVDADMNHDGDIEAGLPLYLPPAWLFIYSVFVEPDFRGQRLYAVMLRSLAAHLRDTEHLLSTTEWTNWRALRSIRRMGFRRIGYSAYLRIGLLRYVKYPKHQIDGLRVGRFIGDMAK